MTARRLATAVALCALAVGACSAPAPAPDAGRSEAYRAGQPDFDLEAASSVDGDSTGVDVALSLPQASLIYRRDGAAYVARVRWSVEVARPGVGTVISRSWEETVRVGSLAATRTFRPIVRTLRLGLPEGVAEVRAGVEDLGTGGVAERSVTLSVESPEAAPALGGLRLVVVRDSGAVPLVARGAVVGADSLRARAQATGLPDGSVATVRVLRLRADTSVAEPPAAFTPMISSLEARGVRPDAADTVFVDQQVLDRPAAAVAVEAPLPPLRPATYRVELDVGAVGEPTFASVARVLTIRRADFPALVRVGDLAAPLVYIATPREMEALGAAQGAFAQRAAFDRFWGERIPDRRQAASTLRAFYERVEEANRLHSTQKEGWKTDPGMVFVVFGPPQAVEQRLDVVVWVYGAGSLLPSVTFDRTASREVDGVPYDVLTLRRSAAYDRAWRAARRRWRQGVVPG